ncbi:HAD-IB family hydrolase [uncultured Anaerococcus sp.]|uniref:HAD family hydrolase n=1 Tax=uncultured Anaerococcus sp. TaxID=293428 RepID=UPI00288A989C|nr:HAD-IB family hydrolase [uncultured Anaerococcus sp.]
MTKAAFFDIDGTLFRNSLLIEHFLKLVEDGILDKKIWTDEIGPLYSKYENRFGAYEDYLNKSALAYQKAMVGLDKKIVDKYAQIVLTENKDKVYNITRNAVKKHIKEGYLIFFISGSPDFLVEGFSKLYEATDSISTSYIFDENNKFTGKVLPMWDGKSKLEAVGKLKEKYNIDLSKSFAYGDTNGDITMFQLVGYPHAVNPSFELIEKLYEDEELRKKSVINIERKDVNYNFALNDLSVKFLKF